MSSVEELDGWESLSPQLRERLAAADLPESLRLDEYDLFLLGPDLNSRDGMLRFGYGTDKWGGEFCLDPNTGAVQVVADNQTRTFVNSSLELYARSLRLVAGLAPAIVGADPDGWEDAKNEMQWVIAEWDAPAMTPDNYWDCLSWDIATGNYANQADL
ncbi:SUKH-4 family immunity protein [Plantactinospora sp. S1510]|uniref:SUKH-4 family immunity protein n=1 Tax=Plantactinospora alkalitolerans TaxID=2789879 RepID=A0ABS0GZ67_9ACTN|nr:SUKH-4 family immunity protein [Plantactinospora alkalitolerans]MBF9131172.1 SUKH-4 family immunity protein [Plantactinospora alkalitolerans]